jgi:acetylornithine deacetylase/succinyl-diaminopimelate desuccinylase-like protein
MLLPEIKSLIVELGHALEADVYLGGFPSGRLNETIVALFEGDGEHPVETFDGIAWEIPRVIVGVRAEDYIDARILSEQIYQSFMDVFTRAIEGTVYLRIELATTPYHDGAHENQPIITFECSPWKQLSV